MIKSFLSEYKSLQLSETKLKQFGVFVGLCILLFCVYQIFVQDTIISWLIVIGLTLLVAGVFRPKALIWPYKIWMSIAIVGGLVFSNIILFVLYFILLTPIAFVLKIMKKDLLGIKKAEGSYWQKRKTRFNNMENLY